MVPLCDETPDTWLQVSTQGGDVRPLIRVSVLHCSAKRQCSQARSQMFETYVPASMCFPASGVDIQGYSIAVGLLTPRACCWKSTQPESAS